MAAMVGDLVRASDGMSMREDGLDAADAGALR